MVVFQSVTQTPFAPTDMPWDKVAPVWTLVASAFVAGSIRATEPFSLSSHRIVPSVARDCGFTAAMLASGTIGVAGKGVGVGDRIGVGEGTAVGDGVGTGAGPMPDPPLKTPRPS